MKKHLEIEFKYRADNVGLEAFVKFCKDFNGLKGQFSASGYDHFYDNVKDSGAFGRLRVGPDSNQLTFKRKTENANNFVRTEHNIDLAPTTSREQIEAFYGEFGYVYNMSLFKSCFVYEYERHIFVYYVCYDTDMKETGRYIEVEMSEDYPWASESDAYEELTVLEKLMKPLGISPQSRVKKSLFELYRKEGK
jgi:adenylate cyclase class IV